MANALHGPNSTDSLKATNRKPLSLDGQRIVSGRPPAQGLYDPANEHDACGIGMIAITRPTSPSAPSASIRAPVTM